MFHRLLSARVLGRLALAVGAASAILIPATPVSASAGLPTAFVGPRTNAVNADPMQPPAYCDPNSPEYGAGTSICRPQVGAGPNHVDAHNHGAFTLVRISVEWWDDSGGRHALYTPESSLPGRDHPVWAIPDRVRYHLNLFAAV